MTSIFKRIAHIFDGDDKIAETALSLVDHAIAAVKETSVGQVVTKAIADAESKSISGVEKFAQVVADVAPTVLAFVADPARELADVLDFTRQLVQSVFNDAKSQAAGAVASAILTKLVPG